MGTAEKDADSEERGVRVLWSWCAGVVAWLSEWRVCPKDVGNCGGEEVYALASVLPGGGVRDRVKREVMPGDEVSVEVVGACMQ